jgi:hypothetical protein
MQLTLACVRLVVAASSQVVTTATTRTACTWGKYLLATGIARNACRLGSSSDSDSSGGRVRHPCQPEQLQQQQQQPAGGGCSAAAMTVKPLVAWVKRGLRLQLSTSLFLTLTWRVT